MEDCYSDDEPYESDPNVSADHGYTSCLVKPSATRYRSIRAQTNAKLIHLAKRLLLANSTRAYNEALDIALIFLRSIPPKGYLAEDLFLLLVQLLQSADHDKLMLKFMSIAGSTTPFLRPMVLVHSARLLAAKGHIYEMKCQVQRNCTEWNLEKHQAAKYYKWVVRHADTLCSDEPKCSSDYRVELEHILATYADLGVLPNTALFNLFIESHAEHQDRVKSVLDRFISLFPGVYFLRRYRAEQCGDLSPVEDIKKCVRDSAYATSTIAFAMEHKKRLSVRERVLMLFDIVIAEPNNVTHWERLLYHLLTEAPFEDMAGVLSSLLRNELARASSLFTKDGTMAHCINNDTAIKYYLATAKIVLFDAPDVYASLYAAVKRATGVTLERRYMEGNNPVWLHFKQMPKQT